MSEEAAERADIATRFQFGNDAWKARSSHGRNPLFADPYELHNACVEYFQWVSDNPLMGVDTAKFQGNGSVFPVPKMRAMTIIGLCNFLDMSQKTWEEYRAKPDFSPVCTQIESIIRQQKFEGAAADMLNPAIIARDLGLADKQEVTQIGAITHIESEYVDAED